MIARHHWPLFKCHSIRSIYFKPYMGFQCMWCFILSQARLTQKLWMNMSWKHDLPLQQEQQSLPLRNTPPCMTYRIEKWLEWDYELHWTVLILGALSAHGLNLCGGGWISVSSGMMLCSICLWFQRHTCRLYSITSHKTVNFIIIIT
jgi:hypothetical protein